MEKSNKYTGMQYFLVEDKAYFKDKAFIILKINFEDEDFENWYLNKILEFEYRSVENIPPFENFDEKVDHCLNIVSKQIYNWIKEYYVYDNYDAENAAWYINETYYDEFIVLSTKNTEETAICFSYHEYNGNFVIPEADVEIKLLTDKDVMNEKWK